MKLKLLVSALALVNFGIANAAPSASVTVITSGITAQIPAWNSNMTNSNQQSLTNSIGNIVTKANTVGATLGVSNSAQVQWSATDTNTGNLNANGIGVDLGILYNKIDNLGAASTSNILTFDSGTWTLGGSAPVVNPGITLTDVATQATALGSNLGNQLGRVISTAGTNLGTSITAYNNLYKTAGSVTAANLSQATTDYNYVSGLITSTSANALAVKAYAIPVTGSSFTTNASVYGYQSGNAGASATAATAPSVNASGNLVFNGTATNGNISKVYATYTDYVLGKTLSAITINGTPSTKTLLNTTYSWGVVTPAGSLNQTYDIGGGILAPTYSTVIAVTNASGSIVGYIARHAQSNTFVTVVGSNQNGSQQGAATLDAAIDTANTW